MHLVFFTPTIAGKYLLTGNVRITTGVADKGMFVAIYKEGAAIAEIVSQWSVNGPMALNISTVVESNGSTDDFELYVKHDHTGDAIVSGDANDTFFQGFRIIE